MDRVENFRELNGALDCPRITRFWLSPLRTSENAYCKLGSGFVPRILPLTSPRDLSSPIKNLKTHLVSTIFLKYARSSGHFHSCVSNKSSCCQYRVSREIVYHRIFALENTLHREKLGCVFAMENFSRVASQISFAKVYNKKFSPILVFIELIKQDNHIVLCSLDSVFSTA